MKIFHRTSWFVPRVSVYDPLNSRHYRDHKLKQEGLTRQLWGNLYQWKRIRIQQLRKFSLIRPCVGYARIKLGAYDKGVNYCIVHYSIVHKRVVCHGEHD